MTANLHFHSFILMPQKSPPNKFHFFYRSIALTSFLSFTALIPTLFTGLTGNIFPPKPNFNTIPSQWSCTGHPAFHPAFHFPISTQSTVGPSTTAKYLSANPPILHPNKIFPTQVKNPTNTAPSHGENHETKPRNYAEQQRDPFLSTGEIRSST